MRRVCVVEWRGGGTFFDDATDKASPPTRPRGSSAASVDFSISGTVLALGVHELPEN